MNITIRRDNKVDYLSMGKYLVKVGVVAACERFDYYSHYSERQRAENGLE